MTRNGTDTRNSTEQMSEYLKGVSSENQGLYIGCYTSFESSFQFQFSISDAYYCPRTNFCEGLLHLQEKVTGLCKVR